MPSGTRSRKCLHYKSIAEEIPKSWVVHGWERPHPSGLPRWLTPRWSLPPMYCQRPNRVRRRY